MQPRTTEQIDDAELIRLAARADEDAFAALYSRHQGGIFRFALQMTGSRATAEEVTHDVFLAIIRGDVRYSPDRGAVGAFLYGVARNRVLHSLRRSQRHVPLEEPEAQLSGESTPLEDLTSAEMIESVRQAVLSLPEAYREVIVLCDLQEMSYTDASVALGIPIGTIRSKLSRGRELLARKLKSGSMRCTA